MSIITFVNDHNAVGLNMVADGIVPLMYKKGDMIITSKVQHHEHVITCLLPGGIEVNLPRKAVKGNW